MNTMLSSDLLLDVSGIRSDLASEWIVHEIVQCEIIPISFDYNPKYDCWQIPQDSLDCLASAVNSATCLMELNDSLSNAQDQARRVISNNLGEKTSIAQRGNWDGWDNDWCRAWPGDWYYMRRIAFNWLEDFCSSAIAHGRQLSPDARRRIRRELKRYPRECAHIDRAVNNAYQWYLQGLEYMEGYTVLEWDVRAA